MVKDGTKQSPNSYFSKSTEKVLRILNIFDEDHAHGVRNLVTNPDLLSEIKE